MTPTPHTKFALPYRAPYRWQELLGFLGARTIAGIETADEHRYARTVRLVHDGRLLRGWLTVQDDAEHHRLSVTLSPELLPVQARVLDRLRLVFDTDCDPDAVDAVLVRMDALRPGLFAAGTRLPGSFDPFEMTVRAVLGQQISVKAARTLAARLSAAFGDPLDTPVAGLTHTFPLPAALCAATDDALAALGLTGSRVRCLRTFSQALCDDSLDLDHPSDPDAELQKLLALPGFGPWTVQYVAMRALGVTDAFPHTDYGVKVALDGRSPKEILALAEDWRPLRAYATIRLWNAL